MKRSPGIHLLICLALAMAIPGSLTLAITVKNQAASIYYEVGFIVEIVACVLNIACGYDKGEKK